MRKGLFKSTTLFCTFDIRNLYTMLPQEEALDILVEFLHVHGYTKVKGIPLETIRLLASIVLKENVFVYGKKIYQQVLGGAMGSSFRLTLANIFMWKWQKELVRRQDMTCEYYGRYIDDVFMTWNKSENALKQILENANAWHPNIKLEYKIGKSLPFLDILLTNINGTLSTSVYHKPAAEPYVVPFTSDHPRHVFDNIVQTSLRRAIKYSSTFQLFNDERRYIKSTFLYNGYPSSFIDKTFRKFFSDYISSRSFLPFLDNEAQFIQMRIALSGQPSRQQSQVEMRIATLTYDKDHLVEDLDKKEEFIIQENKKPNKLQNKLIIHYTHEKRFNTRKRDLHRIFQETFANTQIIETKLIVGNRNQKSTMKEMIRKCPRQAILKNKAKPNLTFKIDESIVNKDEIQATYDEMRKITKDFRTQAMKLYVQSLEREYELLSNEIKRIIQGFPSENDDGFDAEAGCAAFKQYHQLPSRGRAKQSRTFRRPDSHPITERGFLAPAIINQANIKLTEQEHQLLRLGPRFIIDDPKTASRRRTTELATLKRKIETRFFEKKVSPGRPVEQFIAELDVLLQNLHNIPTTKKRIQFNKIQTNKSFDTLSSIIQSSQSQTIIRPKRKKKNYGRIVKRLKHKIHLANTILRKTDKSKVFHLGKVDHYKKKSEEYMDNTKAYQCLGTIDPLQDLIQRTNKYLLDLRLAKWITQKQYEQLSIKPNEVELAHLYYLPKAHKPGTPLRPIISALKHPTIKISKFLDNLLRPLFDQMASNSTVTSGFELVKQLQQWSRNNFKRDTIFCTIDVTDLYTMIPQIEGVLSLRKMLDQLKLKEIGKLKVETIIRLSRFVMTNNYFSYNGQFYHQVRGGAMGSPLTLTISNCCMYFFERQIVNQIRNSGGLYFRYIDDIFITINWPVRHLLKEVERWNKFDENINLSANIGSTVNFLDLNMENQDGQLFTTVYQKPSYEPYYLTFNSIHPLHMKNNIPFAMLLRAIRYCSTFQSYLNESEKLRMALLLNKYPNKIIDEQFNNVLKKFKIIQPLTSNNYNKIRQHIIDTHFEQKLLLEYEKHMFIHFTYCKNMKMFPTKFHTLCSKYFGLSPINDIKPVLGTRNVDNLQRRLIYTKSKND
ncbi:unnamed protein product [Rotaria socialis]